jgi:hypothetical protein
MINRYKFCFVGLQINDYKFVGNYKPLRFRPQFASQFASLGEVNKMLLTRRHFGKIAFSGITLQACESARVQVSPTSETSHEKWMNEAFTNIDGKGLLKTRNSKDLAGQLVVFKFKDPIYALDRPISWRPPSTGSNSDLKPVQVPKGFVTDFASIPRPFWSLVRPDGDYAFAAVVHDYLYWVQDRPRIEADRIFKYAMDDLKIPFVVAEPLYRLVDLGGGSSWTKNSQLKASGEKRVLISLPESQATTWIEWKQRPDVFAK